MRCENCRHWDHSTSHHENEDSGLCRINPPTADDRTGLAVWPFTDAADHCGSFALPLAAEFDEVVQTVPLADIADLLADDDHEGHA